MSVKVNNLLHRMITRSEATRFVCIKDGTKKRIGLELFKSFIQNSTYQGGHLLLLDNPVSHFQFDDSTKIQVHQCLGISMDYSDDLDVINSIPSGRELYIDSLTSLFILHLHQSPKILLDLKKKFSRIVALVSVDTLSGYDMSIINDLADSIIDVSLKGANYETLITHKKPSGRLVTKLVKMKETFNMTDGKVTYVKSAPDDGKQTMGDQTIEDLPFNLRSADEDTLVKKANNLLNIKTTEGGKVYYEPGKEDDVDEEDPDEDLLI